MNCDRCGIEIEEDIEVICSDCVTELERQAERTPLELVAEEMFKILETLAESVQEITKGTPDRHDYEYLETDVIRAFDFLKKIKAQDNLSPLPNPPGPDVHKSAE